MSLRIRRKIRIIKQGVNVERINTSASIKNFNFSRLRATQKKVMRNLAEKGSFRYISEYEIAILCTKLLAKRFSGRAEKKNCAIQYNDATYAYRKINLIFEDKSQYYALRARKNYLKVSVSQMIDLALSLCLQIAANLILRGSQSQDLPQRRLKFFDTISNYYEITKKDQPEALEFIEIIHFRV